ncbi:MAG: transporter substrate-binding domain-containing protein [Desulfomonile tiedjei]|uniref:Transporter substrate-binding domain-containing protein n=1 Tax=Desulfomonile tiedjei TaxID=2358 RepID=A0A9D6V0F9_9BACT|nr:transporter substrate-binding domain-containing protein [Desulfomonile tiedjei]
MDIRSWLVGFLALTALAFPLQDGYCGPTFDRVTRANLLRVGVPYNLVPQGYLNPTGEWVGFEVDLATELAAHMNFKVEKVKVNETTWRSMLSRGQIDAALCRIVHRRALEGEFDFSVPYFFDSPQIMIIKGSFKTAASLKGQKIASVQGSLSEKAAMRLLRQLGDESAEKNVVSFPDRPGCFISLGREKIAGWLDSGMILLEYCSKSPGRFELISAGDNADEIAVALPQDDSAWRDLINFTIQEMAADGTLKKIYDKWFGPDTPQPFPSKRPIEIWPE